MKKTLLAFALAAAAACGATDVVTMIKVDKFNDVTQQDTSRYGFYEKAVPNSAEAFMFQIADADVAHATESGALVFRMNKVSTLRIHSGIDKKQFFGKKAKVTMTAVSDKDAQVALFMEGGINGKHFWRAKDYTLKAGQTTDMELTDTILADDQNPTDEVKDMTLWLRFDVRTPGAEITVDKASIATID